MSNALLDSLAAGFRGDADRRALLDAALRDGLPGPRSERRQDTALGALVRRRFAVADAPPAIDGELLAGIPAPRLVFVNGRFDAALSHPDALPAGLALEPGTGRPAATDADDAPRAPGDDVFARLNAALAGDGVRLLARAGAQVAQPLHLVFVGAPADGDLAWHLRHRIELGAGATLRVIEHHLAAGAHRHLDNSLLSIDVADGATLEHARIQHVAEGATAFTRTEATLQADARYRRVDLELGGARANARAWPRTACCWPAAAATSTPAWASSTSPATRVANCCGTASAPAADAPCSTAASPSTRAPTAPTRGCRTRTCCSRRPPKSTPSRCW